MNNGLLTLVEKPVSRPIPPRLISARFPNDPKHT